MYFVFKLENKKYMFVWKKQSLIKHVLSWKKFILSFCVDEFYEIKSVINKLSIDKTDGN